MDLIVAYNFFGGLSPEECIVVAPLLFPALYAGMVLVGEVLLFAAIVLEPMLPWIFCTTDHLTTFTLKRIAILAAGLLLHYAVMVWHLRERIFPTLAQQLL